MLLRLGAAISLAYFAIADFSGGLGEPMTAARSLLAAGGGILLLAGLWTPVAGALTAIEELCLAFSRPFSHPSDQWLHILLAVLSGGVAMLGPGAWSADARLFGRKRFDSGDRTRRR